MRKLCCSILLLVTMTQFASAQTLAKDILLTITDGAGCIKELRFGLAPTATDGIDAALGEAELPPVPPAGVCDARFIGTDIGIPQLGQGTLKDYRVGTAAFSGTKTYELSYQVGTGTVITITWNLPSGVTGLLEDLFGGVLIKKAMSGKDSLKVTNPSILAKLKMTITYTIINPVALVDFRASAIGTTVELIWRTASETNNYGFEIQRQAATGEFQRAGFVSGYGTTTTPQSYRFADRPLAPGTYFYRLKQIDADGSFDYSAVVEAIVRPAPESFVLQQNYPNPFNPITTIAFVLERAQHAQLSVYDVNGREITSLFNGQAEAGRMYRFAFDGAQQVSGVFIAQLRAGGFIQSRKMLLVR